MQTEGVKAVDVTLEQDICIANGVRAYARNRAVASGKGLIRTCACMVNRRRQRLLTSDCPMINTATVENMNATFGGDW
jgi:hypothetical protein